MNSTENPKDRDSSTPLIATLTVIITVLLSTLAWSGVNQPQAELKPANAAVATATENAPEVTDVDTGCGCAEACLAGH